MQREGVTIILISHNLSVVRRMCSNLIWLENGEMRASGPTEEVANQYRFQSNQTLDQQQKTGLQAGEFRRWGSREIEITAVRFLDATGHEQNHFQTGDPMTVEMAYIAHEPVQDPEFGLAIFRQDGLHVNGPNSQVGGVQTGLVQGTGVIRYEIKELPLLPALYQVSVAIHDNWLSKAYDFHELAYSFRVVSGGNTETDGVVQMPARWDWQPTPN
jgi:hypothetical protein